MTPEQFIKDYSKHCSNELFEGGFHEWLTPEQALRAVEIAKDAFIEKATFYIKQHWIWNTKMIEDFKKYMEE